MFFLETKWEINKIIIKNNFKRKVMNTLNKCNEKKLENLIQLKKKID